MSPHTPEARQRMRDAWTPERRAAQAQRARAMPHESRIRAGRVQKGRAKTPEQIQAIRNAMTPEVRRRIAASRMATSPQAWQQMALRRLAAIVKAARQEEVSA